jgi:predicted DNA-binding protein (MmcQ/YjbR family)
MEPKKYLTGKLLELEGVTVKPGRGSGDKFCVEDEEFAYFIDGGVRVKLNDRALERLRSAIESDPRATFVEKGWVDLSFTNDVEVELVFVYVRYSWKYLTAQNEEG